MSPTWQRRAAAMKLAAVAVVMIALALLLFWPDSGPSDQECREARAWSTPQCREAAGKAYDEALP